MRFLTVRPRTSQEPPLFDDNNTDLNCFSSVVGFTPRSRNLGEAAKGAEISNLKNTVGSLKRLIGRSFNDPDVAIEQEYNTCNLVDVNGQAGVEVNYLGKKEKFTATQLVASYPVSYTHLRAHETDS